ncbi:hypothetical protein HHK36_000403 [Tetracentron sinense]|uniref:SWIM-type domain-containing protein n=1 Tax=Tetracentron sinense TaxID=13715 RepID=A0A834ZR09_TETSI|nr:hypothetical protein HHK36_000403 [Tetracentron sinense]
MARWDEILSLPVQNPPTLEFSSAEMVWSKVEGWRDNIDRVALIPFARVDDFVRGESSNKDCPTRFHVEARRRRPPEMPYKPKVDGILEYILYWCSFGPDDHRKGGIVRPSRSTYVPKKKSAGRPNTKRGCTCHFIVKRLIAEPSVALIIYNQEKHVDKKGLPCHGPQDKKAAGTRAMFAPYISDDLRLRVLSLLYVGVSVETIMQRHNESVERQGGPCNRDDLLTHRYVRIQERNIRRSTYELDTDDAVSIKMWVESHQSHVFFYEDFSDSDPFILGIQTEWQLQQMIRFGNRSLLAADSRFGTNKLKYSIHSILVFNSENKAIPVAWIITPRFASGDAHKWIRALYSRVRTKDPTWKLAGFIVDDPSVDVLAIREVFQCSILICFWRVRHAWHKNLVQKCSETEMRVEISRRLEQAVYSICKGIGNADVFEDFMEDFVDCSDFLDYFKAIWYPRIGMWTTALKTLPLASQETCAAMECYHHQLKLRLLNEKDPSVYQRADWLVNKLGTKVHSYFWLDEYSGKDEFARYWKDEWMSGLTSWRRALEIPDTDVTFEGSCVKVISQHDRENAHVVWNPGSEFAICDCNWSGLGNLCKHVIKVSKICREKGSALTSISLFEYNQALVNMLYCPPHDSLIRDHAVSLAVCVQMQLNALVDQESSQTALGPVEKQIGNGGSANEDRDAVNESQGTNENILFSNENASEVGYEAQGGVAGDLGGEKVIDRVAYVNGVCCESVEQIISSSKMDVDPLSICTFPSELLPVVGIASTDGLSENGERELIAAGPGTGTSENLSSHDDAFAIRNGAHDDIPNKDCHEKMIGNVFCGNVLEGTITISLMDVDPQSIEIPLQTFQTFEKCTMSSDNGICSNVAESTVISNTMDVVDPHLSQTSPSVSMPVELQPVDVIKSTDTMSENGGRDLENGSDMSNLPSIGNGFTLGGVEGGMANESCHDDVIDWLASDNGISCHDAKGAGNMVVVHPEAMQTPSLKSRSVEQPVVELVAGDTGVCDNTSGENGPSNTMDATYLPIQISSSSLEVKQEAVTEIVSIDYISEIGEGDVIKESQCINEKSFCSINPSTIRCETQNDIADGDYNSDGISQLAGEGGVCGNGTEGTFSKQSISASPSRIGSFKQKADTGLVANDDVCDRIAEETVCRNTMDVDEYPSLSELNDVGQQTENVCASANEIS